jgi:DUF971 family protein
MFEKLLNRNGQKAGNREGTAPDEAGSHPAGSSANTADDGPWPDEIRLKSDRKTLEVRYEDGRSLALSAEYLRVYSPSAEVRGHGNEERKIIGGKRNVEIIKVEPVGNYAVRLSFDDLHNTGIYSWAYLAEMADKQEQWWSDYMSGLEEKALSRD